MGQDDAGSCGLATFVRIDKGDPAPVPLIGSITACAGLTGANSKVELLSDSGHTGPMELGIHLLGCKKAISVGDSGSESRRHQAHQYSN